MNYRTHILITLVVAVTGCGPTGKSDSQLSDAGANTHQGISCALSVDRTRVAVGEDITVKLTGNVNGLINPEAIYGQFFAAIDSGDAPLFDVVVKFSDETARVGLMRLSGGGWSSDSQLIEVVRAAHGRSKQLGTLVLRINKPGRYQLSMRYFGSLATYIIDDENFAAFGFEPLICSEPVAIDIHSR